jgi:hypothetical protein
VSLLQNQSKHPLIHNQNQTNLSLTYMAITCSTVNDLFQRETNRFSVDVHERYSVDGPWGRLVRVGKFPQGMGVTLSEITVERVLSGSFENSWSDVGTSNGTSSNGCVPAPNDLSFGQTIRTWNLQTKSYQTPCICLDDLKTAFQIENQIAKTVTQLTQLTKTVLDNRRRSEYLRLVSKVASGYNTEYASLKDVPPTVNQLAQDQLDELRVRLIRDGAGHNALGKENGTPVLGLITSPETSRQLLRNNSELRQDLRYATPSELIAPLGVERSFGGFYHMADLEVPRFNYTVGTNDPNNGNWVQVYPFVQSSTNTGYKWEPNPAYNTAAYEAAYIFHPDVYEEAVQQVGPNIPGAAFDDYPYYYSGQFFWLNIRDAVNNPLGKIGRWMSVFTSGSRPIAPYLGRVILHKRCANDFGVATCTNS